MIGDKVLKLQGNSLKLFRNSLHLICGINLYDQKFTHMCTDFYSLLSIYHNKSKREIV